MCTLGSEQIFNLSRWCLKGILHCGDMHILCLTSQSFHGQNMLWSCLCLMFGGVYVVIKDSDDKFLG